MHGFCNTWGIVWATRPSLSGWTNHSKNSSPPQPKGDRSGAQLLRDFMREFVQQQDPAAYNTWFAQEVQAGVDSANAGKLIPNADVEARFAARRAAARRSLDAAK